MFSKVATRSFHASRAALHKVAVLGAAGGIGAPLSLLLKDVDAITHLSLVDRSADVVGVAADVSHINTKAKISGHTTDDLKTALTGAAVVVIPAGVPRKPGMTRDDLFNVNGSIVADLVGACAKYCPTAHLLIISNPVNSTVPIAAGILKKAGVYDPKRLFGVTTLDVVRANAFLAESQGWDARKTDVPVVGGHAGETILPLFSQVKGAKLSAEQTNALTVRVQFGGDEVVKAKAAKVTIEGKEVEGRGGSATLSMAYAGARFVHSLLRAITGERGVTECAYVQSDAKPELSFFATRVELGKNGVEKVHPIGPVTPYEQAWLDKMVPDLKGQIKKGVEFAAGYTPKA